MGFIEKAINFISYPHPRTTGLLNILLLVSVLFLNVVLVQQQQSLSQRAATSTCTQEGQACTTASSIPGTCVINKTIGAFECSLNGDYKPTSVVVTTGQLVSGDYSSLSSKDNSSLVINSATSSGSQIVDWYAEYTLPAGQKPSNLSVNYTSKYSTPQGQDAFIYNFTNSNWQSLRFDRIGESMYNIEVSSVDPYQKKFADYVSPDGKVRIRLYASGTAAFTAYTDYLKIGVTFSDTPIPTPTPTPTPTPILTPTPIPTLPPNAISGDYFPTSITMLRAETASGDHSSLRSRDGSSLVLSSITSSGYHLIDWYPEFTLPSRQVSNLSLSYTGKYSTWRGQTLFLYNFTTSAWQKIDSRNIGASIVSFELPSIASPTNYISPDGQVQVRVFSISTAGFTSYTDYLKIGVVFSEATPIPTSTTLLTPTPTLLPTSTPTPTLPPNAVSGDYKPTSISVIRGQIVSGNYSSLGDKTNDTASSLIVNSMLNSGYQGTDWYAEFTLPSRQVSNLSLSYTGKYSTWRGQTLFLYNFTTSAWQKIDSRNIGASIVSFELPSIASPTNYISPDGQVQVRVFSISTAGFTAYTDYLKIGVRY